MTNQRQADPRGSGYADAEALVLREGDHGTYDPPGILEEPREATIRDLLYVLTYDRATQGNLAVMALAGMVDELELVRYALIAQSDDSSLEHLFQLAERHLRRMTHRAQAIVELQQRVDRAEQRTRRVEPCPAP